MTTKIARKPKKKIMYIGFAHMWDGDYLVRVRRGKSKVSKEYRPKSSSLALRYLGLFFTCNPRLAIHLEVYPTIAWIRGEE